MPGNEFSVTKNNNSTIYIDASTGDVLYKTEPNLAIYLYNAWRKGLHFGTWGGEATTLIYFVFGMMPLVLLFTGIVICQLKSRARKRNYKKKTADAVAA